MDGYVPDFDIVWHGEPAGDRRAQAAAIVKEGIERGARGALHGRKSVRISATNSQFHAITPTVRHMSGVGFTIFSIRCRSLTPIPAPP